MFSLGDTYIDINGQALLTQMYQVIHLHHSLISRAQLTKSDHSEVDWCHQLLNMKTSLGVS